MTRMKFKLLNKVLRKRDRVAKYSLMTDSATSNRLTMGPKFLAILIFGFISIIFMFQLIFLSLPNSFWQIYFFNGDGITMDEEYDEDFFLELGVHSPNETVHALENSSTAQFLYNEVKVLCWIMTSPNNHKKKAMHVLRTWGPRCNKLLFMSTKEDEELGTIALNVTEGYIELWGKTKEAFRYIYKHHFNDADWFFKADDDTFAVMENLRYYLYPYSTNDPIFHGSRLKGTTKIKDGYFSGGAGYVLSKEALRRFVEYGIDNKTICRPEIKGVEDIEVAKCFEKLNVYPADSRDEFGRQRFLPMSPEYHINLTNKTWYWEFAYRTPQLGLNCCSDRVISFHKISPQQMHVLNYLIYHVKVYGIVQGLEPLPGKLSFYEATDVANGTVVNPDLTTNTSQFLKN